MKFNTFKTDLPQNLITRLFVLEYIRLIPLANLYEKANKKQKELYFYKYSDNENKVQFDLNWEYLLFEASLSQLEFFVSECPEDIAQAEKIILNEIKSKLPNKNQKENEQSLNEVDVNLYEMAKNFKK